MARLLVAYILFFAFARPGVYLGYLDRWSQAYSHALAFAGFGVSWVVDFLRMPHYVRVANNVEQPKPFSRCSLYRLFCQFTSYLGAAALLSPLMLLEPEVSFYPKAPLSVYPPWWLGLLAVSRVLVSKLILDKVGSIERKIQSNSKLVLATGFVASFAELFLVRHHWFITFIMMLIVWNANASDTTAQEAASMGSELESSQQNILLRDTSDNGVAAQDVVSPDAPSLNSSAFLNTDSAHADPQPTRESKGVGCAKFTFKMLGVFLFETVLGGLLLLWIALTSNVAPLFTDQTTNERMVLHVEFGKEEFVFDPEKSLPPRPTSIPEEYGERDIRLIDVVAHALEAHLFHFMDLASKSIVEQVVERAIKESNKQLAGLLEIGEKLTPEELDELLKSEEFQRYFDEISQQEGVSEEILGTVAQNLERATTKKTKTRTKREPSDDAPQPHDEL